MIVIRTPHSCRAHAGFTLIELLVTISIIAVLASISLPLYQRTMISGRQAKGIANMRNAGTAIMAYAAENNNTLPGPCGLGIIPTCNSTSKASGDLAGFIAPYLGITVPTNSTYVIVPALVSPGVTAYSSALAKPTSRIPHYIQSDMLRGTTNSGGPGTIRPFGYAGTSGSAAINDPLRLTRLGDFTNDTGQPLSSVNVWLLSDADQQLTDVQAKASGWFVSLPPKPVYGATRLRMYADGHAGAAPLSEK